MCDSSFLPKFCSPLPATLPNAALVTAVNARAFLCLPDEMIDIVIRRYVEFIHPQIPVLCLNTLLAMFETSSERTISILLWQALTTAVMPFLTDSELGMSGLVSITMAVRTYLNRTKTLLDLQIETCEITEVQAILLLCWRSRVDDEAAADYRSLMKRAQQIFERIGSESAGQISTLSYGNLLSRLQWSHYLLRATSTTRPLLDFVRTSQPPVITPPTLEGFEVDWLFLSRAQIWYGDLGTHQAFARHLQQVSCFCKKVELYAKLRYKQKQLSEQSSTRNIGSKPTGESTLPVSEILWTAHDLDTTIETIIKAGNLQIDLQSNDDVTVWSNRTHYLDLILQYRLSSFSLLWSEKLSQDTQLPNPRTAPAHKVAKDLIHTKLAQSSVSISRIVSTLCHHRLCLLAHNINPHILAHLTAIATRLDTQAHSRNTREAVFLARLGAMFAYSIRAYTQIIAMQSTSLTPELHFESAPEAIIAYGRIQGGSPEGASTGGTTTTTTPGGEGPETPVDGDALHMESIAISCTEKDCVEGGEEVGMDAGVIC